MEDNNGGQGTEGAGTEGNEGKEFDASAFMTETPVAKVPENLGDGAAAPPEGGETKLPEGDGAEEGSAEEAFSWDNAASSESEADKATRLESEAATKLKLEEEAAAEGGEELSQEQKDAAAKEAAEAAEKLAESGITNNDSFKELNEQLGTKFESVDEMKDHLVKLEKKNEELSKNQNVGLDNDKIQNLKKLKGNSNEELVKMDLERQGFKDEKLNEAMDKLTDNGMIDIEAQKILNTIDNAIGSEQNKITESNNQADAKQKQDYEDNVIALNKHLNETETMFGFNMAKDAESLKEVRADHQEYITSGNFLGEVTADAESISKGAWLWRHRETLEKALIGKGHTEGKAEILKDIGVPEITGSTRIKGPEASDGFNPSKFTHGT